jgi:hypothetical protein
MCDKLQSKLGSFGMRIRFYSYDLPLNCVPKIIKIVYESKNLGIRNVTTTNNNRKFWEELITYFP